MFYLLLARPLMDISCLSVSCHETMATIIVQFCQPIQVSVMGNIATYFCKQKFRDVCNYYTLTCTDKPYEYHLLM